MWDGKDYRGVDVVGYLSSVPGTNWFMVTKIDKSEMYADLYLEGTFIIIGFFLILLVIVAGLISIYTYRQRNIFQELWKSSEELSTTLHSIGDGVISTDKHGIVLFMNQVAERITGWNIAEAKGKNITEVFKILNEETRKTIENPVDKVILR